MQWGPSSQSSSVDVNATGLVTGWVDTKETSNQRSVGGRRTESGENGDHEYDIDHIMPYLVFGSIIRAHRVFVLHGARRMHTFLSRHHDTGRTGVEFVHLPVAPVRQSAPGKDRQALFLNSVDRPPEYGISGLLGVCSVTQCASAKFRARKNKSRLSESECGGLETILSPIEDLTFSPVGVGFCGRTVFLVLVIWRDLNLKPELGYRIRRTPYPSS